VVLGFFVSSAIQVADQWSKAVVLRLGKFRSLEGPGLFVIILLIDNIPYWLDIGALTSSFKAEKTLTKDTVPVDVDAVLFWKIVDPKKAALDAADYQSAVGWVSQTALRDVIGKTMLCDMLEGRDKISNTLRKIIDERTEAMEDQCYLSRGQGCVDSAELGECDVDASPSRARASGPRDSGRFRAPSGREFWRGREDLRQ
jgi:regulator of protease activity HflC (stomatin/prohibitin superfamily)